MNSKTHVVQIWKIITLESSMVWGECLTNDKKPVNVRQLSDRRMGTQTPRRMSCYWWCSHGHVITMEVTGKTVISTSSIMIILGAISRSMCVGHSFLSSVLWHSCVSWSVYRCAGKINPLSLWGEREELEHRNFQADTFPFISVG